MTDQNNRRPPGRWSNFPFQVKWDSTELVFPGSNGLSSETQVIEYRGGKQQSIFNGENARASEVR